MRKSFKKFRMVFALLLAILCVSGSIDYRAIVYAEAEKDIIDINNIKAEAVQSLENEGSIETEAEFTDSNGVTYSYYGHNDKTATIHLIEGYTGNDVNIPEEIDGYTVTRITSKLPYGAEISTLTIPESVVYVGVNAFSYTEIGSLHFNASAASISEGFLESPFISTNIGKFNIGENVQIIPAKIFSQTKFKGSVSLSTGEIGSEAFINAVFEELTITDMVKTIHKNAFMGTEIQSLHYNTNASHAAADNTESAFYGAKIYSMNISEHIKNIPDYAFAFAQFCFDELTINQEGVGDEAFYAVWSIYGQNHGRLYISPNVKYAGACAFAFNNITSLNLDADIGTASKDTLSGVFAFSEIKNISIGSSVKIIPDYLFCNANITQGTLNLDVVSIGKYAFYNKIIAEELVIGKDVENIGIKAFGCSEISDVYYNAVEAEVGEGDTIKADEGPFWFSTLSNVCFGKNVALIPRCLFSCSKMFLNNEGFPDSVKSIGDMAFYSFLPGEIKMKGLTIGENMEYIGKSAFYFCSFDDLTYLAKEAIVKNVEEVGDSPFYGAEASALSIGENVSVLPDYIFGGIGVTQEELVIPDGVSKIGDYALCGRQHSSGGLKIGTLVIGNNITHIGNKAFAYDAFDKAVVLAVHTDSEFKEVSLLSDNLPVCKYVDIHKGSDFYQYFTENTADEKITLLCKEFETVYGEEYFDKKTGSFVTPYKNACVVCGYGIDGQDAKKALSVIFLDYNGKVIDRQTVKYGGSANAPKNPVREGYNFIGWDKAFNNVTENINVTAQYELVSDKSKPDNTPKPSDEPKPDNTPKPSNEPKPDNTPKPSGKPKPDNTPKPSDEQRPDNTPKPSDEPKFDNTPSPSDEPKPDDKKEPDKGQIQENEEITEDLMEEFETGETKKLMKAPFTGETGDGLDMEYKNDDTNEATDIQGTGMEKTEKGNEGNNSNIKLLITCGCFLLALLFICFKVCKSKKNRNKYISGAKN